MKRSSSGLPTIKDVAREAGVSSATVSYVVNNADAAERMTEETKQRVWTAVKRLGYRFNPIGRALQRGYSNQLTLLIVTWDLATSHSATAMAISRAAARHELALTVHVADDDTSAEDYLRQNILNHLSGVLVLWDSPAFEQSLLRRLAADRLPVIDLLPGTPDGLSVVTADREDAGFRATRHLLNLGHRAIGFIGDNRTRAKTTLRKLAGYRRALESAGVRYRKELLQNVTGFGFEGGQEGFRELCARRPDVTGLFCINDPIALGAIEAAGDMGWACPERLSVIGFGDAPEGRHWRPKLSTFALSPEKVASEAIGLILERKRGKAFKSRTVLVPEELILRESVGPAPPVQRTERRARAQGEGKKALAS